MIKWKFKEMQEDLFVEEGEQGKGGSKPAKLCLCCLETLYSLEVDVMPFDFWL